MPLISVIVPVYKVEKYLVRCVNSILKQTLSDIEVILVNDGSPDKSGEICDEFALKDMRVKVVHKENGGLSSARNAGICIAEGEYIQFVDSDDWIEPNMLEVMYNESVMTAADLVICNYKKVYDDHDESSCLRFANERIDVGAAGLEKYFFKYILSYVHGDEAWNKLYAAKIIKENNIRFELNHDIFAEDMLFNLYYLCHVKKVSSVNCDFYNYFQRENSIIRSKRPGFTRQYAELFTRFVEYYRRYNKIAEIKKAVPNILYSLMFACSKYIVVEKDYSMDAFMHFSSIPGYGKYMQQNTFGYGANELKHLAGFSLKRRMKIRVLSLLFYFKMFKTVLLLVKIKQGLK